MPPEVEAHETPEYRVGSDQFESKPIGPHGERRRHPTGEIHAVDREGRVMCNAEIEPDQITEIDWTTWPDGKCNRCRERVSEL